MKDYIRAYMNETIQIAQEIDQTKVEEAINLLQELKDRGGRLFILGVGGSAANASHAVNDFRKIGGIEAYAATDNISEITARTNDEGWGTVFVEFLRTSKLNEKDALFILSVGGGTAHTSENLVIAMEYARKTGAGIVSIVSRTGGMAKEYSDVCILVPVVNENRITPHAEGWQGILWHLIVNSLK